MHTPALPCGKRSYRLIPNTHPRYHIIIQWRIHCLDQKPDSRRPAALSHYPQASCMHQDHVDTLMRAVNQGPESTVCITAMRCQCNVSPCHRCWVRLIHQSLVKQSATEPVLQPSHRVVTLLVALCTLCWLTRPLSVKFTHQTKPETTAQLLH